MAKTKLPESFVYARDAGADLSSNLHYLAHVDTDGDIVLAGDGEHVLGVIIEAAEAGKPVTVQFGGIGKCVTGENITAGERLVSGAAGTALGSSASAGDFEFGTALESANSGELVSFAFLPGRKHA